MKFLGIDLGWSSGSSGLCCLEGKEELKLLSLERKLEITEILDWVDKWVQPNEAAIIAVDAPTLIPNLTGMRLPDKLTHKYFGRYHAGCYPANLARPFAERTVQFGLSLEQRGFIHAPKITPQEFGRYQIEVFPHPATINLFRLERILKYKKGTITARRLELIKLRQSILEILPTLEPSLKLSQLPDVPQSGIALKSLEDCLDSLICAYIAAHWWYWGIQRNVVLGDIDNGYIVIPTSSNEC